MKIIENIFDKCFVIEPGGRKDSRGEMEVLYDNRELKDLLGGFKISEQRIYKMPSKHTFFGIHYQKSGRGKLISVVQGKALDYIVDLRPDSETYKSYKMIELDEDNPRIVFVASGFGHAFLSLTDNTIQSFAVDGSSSKDGAGIVSYKDPSINLKLPCEDLIISDYDLNAALLNP